MSCNKTPIPGENGEGGSSDPVTPSERNLYVSPEGSDSNNGLATVFAFRSFEKVLEEMRPGDVINIMPGEYRLEDRNIGLELTPLHSGEEGKYITFKAYDPDNRPVIVAGGEKSWNAVVIRASYIIFDGLEFRGLNAELDSLEAYNGAKYFYDHPEERATYIGKLSKFNTNCISVSGDSDYISTNVIIRNCVVHDFPGCGIGASGCDYVTIENNTVYNNAWFCMYACSGISLGQALDSDASIGHKMIVRGNVCFNNRTMIPWFHNDTFEYSDGNGIIIDINNGSTNGGTAYNGRTLVCNNVSFWNGGSGIHAFGANHVDIINNTGYFNGRKYADGEYADIYAHWCEDVNIVNNIMYARKDGDCNKQEQTGIVYENNLLFNGRAYEHQGSVVADPMFVNPTTDLSADFHLKAGSPAIGMGTDKPYMPDTDIEGTPRNTGSIDVGAYCFK